MSDQEHVVDDCNGPVVPEPTKEEIVPVVELVDIECSLPEEAEPAQRRSNFSGSGLDSLGQGNIL